MRFKWYHAVIVVVSVSAAMLVGGYLAQRDVAAATATQPQPSVYSVPF